MTHAPVINIKITVHIAMYAREKKRAKEAKLSEKNNLVDSASATDRMNTEHKKKNTNYNANLICFVANNVET